tara:strand:+ start:600 stop:1445 length:846 start_codon:yes stop_codon:yes gene_type:complete
MRDDFAVFILTHGRPNNVLTKKTLDRCGYDGRIVYIVDNEDSTAEEYCDNFGKNNVYIFDKKLAADRIDEANNFDNRNVIVHARNVCFDLARKMGINYFVQLDDDYYELTYKFANSKGLLLSKNINKIFCSMLSFLDKSNAAAIAFSQCGDFIGGVDNGKGSYRFNKRKCMNSFFCKTERPFEFVGSINEDVNTYTTLASRGVLFLTVPVFAINQKCSQKQNGGMTDIYRANGTYVKSFTTVLMQPSSVKVSLMNANHKRLHHSISWKNVTPQIISESHKK